MTAPERPHCLQSEACEAKAPRHCRRCAGIHGAAKTFASPEARAASRERLIALNRDPEVRRKMVATMRANPSTMANLAAAGKRAGELQRANPDAVARRLAASAEGSKRRSLRLVEETAKRVNIPVSLVTEFRELRRNRLTKEQARGVLARSYPAAFAVMHEAFLAKHRRIIDRRQGARTC